MATKVYKHRCPFCQKYHRCHVVMMAQGRDIEHKHYVHCPISKQAEVAGLGYDGYFYLYHPAPKKKEVSDANKRSE